MIYDVDIDGMTSLTLGGSAPILLVAPGDNLDKTVVHVHEFKWRDNRH